ncbi:MAG TPA: ABC transporter ATP-binding protein [Anaerolineales bacterium]|nr:ABC transporter ATP-binding protein [Anaerolineales bacterium]HLA82562.1 ABC transporter ATP-binding protein [Thermoleophilia bacterium]
MASVVYDHVTKRFGDVAAVNDLSLHVADKEFLVLVGPSGCGKTTALRLLAGLEEISDGRILIDERVVNDVPPKDRDIAMVFQSYALYPHMSVYDNMAFGLKLRKMPKEDIKRRVNEAAQMLDLQELLERKPRQLSGGQRQRVAVGRAIVREPKVFLFDEPLSNLDAKLRVQTRAQISKLHQRLATTFIYVTHDQVEAMTMATRIAVIKDGLLQQMDSPQSLYDHPGNVFVAGFIGSPAMNFFTARLARADGGLALETRGFAVRVPASKAPAYERHIGKEVIFGIRPEDVHDTAFVPPQTSSASIEAQVDVTELMGNEIFVHLVSGNMPFIGRIDPRSTFRVGDRVQAAFNMDHMHVFEKEGDQTAVR